jgi:integrase/recombinase XerD
MEKLRDRMEADLTLGGYSAWTVKIYLDCAKKFAEHFPNPPGRMGEAEVREYLLYLIKRRKLSRSYIKQVRAALIFLYRVTLKRPMEVANLPTMRRQQRLPKVLSGSEMIALLAATESPKYRLILMTMYGSGLRIFEACQLTAGDIDSKRMLIHVRLGKGGRDRYTVLSKRLLSDLRDYYRAARPQTWLFPGISEDEHVTTQSVRKVLAKAVAAAGITKRVTPHTLRHSFATHLIESGKDVTVVQELLGHRSLCATMIYTHISVDHIGRTQSPLDLLGTKNGVVLG